MKIVTLMENTAPCGLIAEHGLSLYIETEAHKILFDTGASGAFADNAKKLGIDLSRVDMVVLSHGHYDHGGGLSRFLEENTKAKIYVNCHGFDPHFNAQGKEIGLDPSLKENPRFVFVEGQTQLAENLSLHTIPLPPEDSAGMTVLENGLYCPEDFRHEQYLIVEEAGKRACFSGCSHKGIRLIANYFQPDFLIGGFHFMKVQDAAFLEEAARVLCRYDTVYYTGHCTGQIQYAMMKRIMGERLHSLSTGTVIEL